MSNVSSYIENIDLIKISLNNDYSLVASVHMYLIVIIIIISGIILIINIYNISFSNSFEIDEAELNIGNQKLKLIANNTDIQIAYSIWVELSTRKIGLLIDEESDLIFEIYNSWYTFFSVTRELIKDIPITKLKKKETRNLVKLSIDILNMGIRPHLKKWQAKYRKWYNFEINKEENSKKSPQEIQRQFPQYDLLMNDLKDVNSNLIKYKGMMEKFIKE